MLLKDRYDVLREVGQGGMATVYLARDVRHPRQVALKVFRPELAAGVGPERFLREIAVASGLSHPNILALYDSGEIEGLLYYVMPFIDGESVGSRLAREGQFPIDEALSIARQVAAALHYSHAAGVVHRDIKPDNILLSGGNALVADFGIAHAVDRTGEQRLTVTGFSVGTPAYMSPEQISGTTRLDGRSDVYSLGCVLYAMLIGEPPFTGPSAQAIVARHLAEPAPRMRVVRPTIPSAVEAAVNRALAKSPADRFVTAAAFAAAISPESISHDVATGTIARTSRWRAPVLAATATCVLLAAALLIRPWSLIRRSPAATLDANVVAVPTFHVGGVTDSALQRLAAGVADLVVQRLPGDGGPRAVAVAASPVLDDRSVLAAARNAGAGRVIQGSMAAMEGRVSLSATFKAVRGDSILARVDNVTGGRDSLPALVDRLVIQLLVQSTRIPDPERAALARLSLPVLRSYLAAERAFIHGQFQAAGRLYDAVLASDSTCFPAAFGLGAVSMVLADPDQTRRALTLAEAQRRVMTWMDSAFLRSLRWPLEHGVGLAVRLARSDSAATDATQGIRWYLLGERLFHDGPLLGIPDVLQRAAGSFERALRLEPEFVPALGASIDLAAARGDTAAARSLARRYFALDSTSNLADYYRWRVAVAFGDKRALSAVRARIDRFDKPALERIVNVAQLDGVALPDALRAAAALWQQSGASAETRWAFMKQRELALNRGRPAEARALLARWQATVPFRPRDGLAEVVNALYWGADTTFPARWVSQSAAAADGRGHLSSGSSDELAYIICGVNLWRVNHGTIAGVAEGVRRLRMGYLTDPSFDDMGLCAETIDAELAQLTGAPDARARLVRLDSLAATAPPVLTWLLVAANLTAARLWEAAGAPDKALAAVRRRPYVTDFGEPRVLVGLSTMLREEGRLAAHTGDTAAAIVAYRRYLALRDDPEPANAAEVTGVRAELSRLVRSSAVSREPRRGS